MVWRRLPEVRSILAQRLSQGEYRDFLVLLAEQHYTKAAKTGAVEAAFGLARATYVLHMFSHAKFPIYDSNTQSVIHFLTQGQYRGQTIQKTKLAFAILLALRVHAEERMMVKEFGDEYEVYSARTKRLIPGVW